MIFYSGNPGSTIIRERNSTAANINNIVQSNQGIYDFPSDEDEDDDANVYSEIRNHPQQQREFVDQSNEYHVCSFSNASTLASARLERKEGNQIQDDAYEAYSHLSCVEKNNEDYQTLSLNPVSLSSIKLKECKTEVSYLNLAA